MTRIFFTAAVWSDLKWQSIAACEYLDGAFSYDKTVVSPLKNVDEVSFVIVSIHENEVDNEKSVKKYSKRGSYRDFITGDRRRVLSLGVGVLPSDLSGVDGDGFARVFLKNLVQSIQNSRNIFKNDVEFELFCMEIGKRVQELLAY
ncbi:hypothetical protein [Caulobacter sp. D5]|uniref:hypothetical protein n=1 Tax=Caulobacter sp. D5 TaxID=357400 RepID=UPI0011B62CBA|nr:hypothetical protein [Caulobacter sp. D5]